MYEGLIEFIESSLFSVINQTPRRGGRLKQAEMIVLTLLRFAQKTRPDPRAHRRRAGPREPRLKARINNYSSASMPPCGRASRWRMTRARCLPDAATAARMPTRWSATAAVGRCTAFVKGRLPRRSARGLAQPVAGARLIRQAPATSPPEAGQWHRQGFSPPALPWRGVLACSLRSSVARWLSALRASAARWRSR